jgi:hypothetical protein
MLFLLLQRDVSSSDLTSLEVALLLLDITFSSAPVFGILLPSFLPLAVRRSNVRSVTNTS